MEKAVQEILAVAPKGSLFGAIHCAAVNPAQNWPTKMTDKLKVRPSPVFLKGPALTPVAGFPDRPQGQRVRNLLRQRRGLRRHQLPVRASRPIPRACRRGAWLHHQPLVRRRVRHPRPLLDLRSF